MISNKKISYSLLTLFFLICVLDSTHSQNTYSKIHIVSNNEFTRTVYKSDLGSVSTASSNLTYNSNLSTYYNTCYLDAKKSNTISHEDFTIDLYLKDINPRNGRYDFEIPIKNLNAKTGYQYYSTNYPKLKQNVEDIYWGFVLNVRHKGIDESIVIWIKKLIKSESYGNYEYTYYNVSNSGWKERYQYPDPESDYSSKLKIISWDYSNTSMIYWGDNDIYLIQVPYFIDAINSIQVLVGCQADVKFGKAEIKLGAYCSQETLDKHYNSLSDLMKAEEYFSAKTEAKQWVQKDGNTTEFNAYTLAYCQIRRNEMNDCIETCNALVEYNGDYVKQSYLFRGLAKEANGDIQGALSDYNSSGSIGAESYNKLIQRTNNNNQLQKSSKNSSSHKPQLRK